MACLSDGKATTQSMLVSYLKVIRRYDLLCMEKSFAAFPMVLCLTGVKAGRKSGPIASPANKIKVRISFCSHQLQQCFLPDHKRAHT